MKTKVILCTVNFMAGITVGVWVISKVKLKRDKRIKQLSDKHLTLMFLLNQWLKTKQEGKELVEYFHRNNIKNIAIYGMSHIGERLYDELKDSDIEVNYAIDKDADKIYAEIDVLLPDGDLPEVDAIVVTPVFYYEDIREMLNKKINSPVLSLEDILYDL